MRYLMILPVMMTAACAAPGVEMRMIDRGISSADLGADARLAEAEGLLRLGNTGLAIEAYRKVLRAEPANARAHAGLANAYDRMGRYDLSSRHYETALAHAPADPAMYEAFAASKLRQGDRIAANALLGEAADRAARRAAMTALGDEAALTPAPAPVAVASAAPVAAPVAMPVEAPVAEKVATGPRLERLSGHEVLLSSRGTTGEPALAVAAAPAVRDVAVARAFDREAPALELAALVDDRPAIITIASRDSALEGAPKMAMATVTLPTAINGPTPDMAMAAAVAAVPMASVMAAAPLATGPVVAPAAPAAPVAPTVAVSIAAAPAPVAIPMAGSAMAPLAGTLVAAPAAPSLPVVAVPLASLSSLAAPAAAPVVAPPAPSRAPVAVSAVLAAAPAPLAAAPAPRLTVIDTAMIAAVALAADESLSGLAGIVPPAPPVPAPAAAAATAVPVMAAPVAPAPTVAPVAAPVAVSASSAAATAVPTLAASAAAVMLAAGIADADLHDASARRGRSIILYPAGQEAEAQRLADALGFAIAVQRGPVERITLHLGKDAGRALLPRG